MPALSPLKIRWSTLLLILAACGLVAGLFAFGARSGAGVGLAPPGATWLNEGAASLLARFLAVPAEPGQSLMPRIRFERPWPQLAALGFGLAAVCLVVWLYRRERGISAGYKTLLAAIRILLVLLAMFLLAEAVLVVERTGLPSLAILVDDSASGSITDGAVRGEPVNGNATRPDGAGEEPTRLAVAQEWLTRRDGSLFQKLIEQYRVRLYLVSGSTRLLAEVTEPAQVAPALAQLREAQALGDQSRLGDGVREVITEAPGGPPSAVLLFSDGQNTDGEPLTQAADLALSKGVPVLSVGLGSPDPVRDLELTDLQVDEVAFVDDPIRFEARLAGRGMAGQSVEVVLRRRPAQGEEDAPAVDLERVAVAVPADGETETVEIRHQPSETGEFVYELAVEPLPRELQVENNRVARAVSVREDKVRVLLVEGVPRYEFRYLLSYLKRDKTIELHTVLQAADQEYAEQEATALATFPSQGEGDDGLFRFDVVIFGDVDLTFLSTSQMRTLVEFVEKKGGGLLLIAGPNHNPLSYRGTLLEPLIPINLSEARDPATVGAVAGFRPSLTVEGRSHPIFRFDQDEAASARIWGALPELDWFLEAPRRQELAFVLAAHPSLSGSDGPLPLVLYQYVGAGKTLLQCFDESWKWRFRVGDRYFGRYWVQAIRFMARSKLLGRQAELTTDRRRYSQRQPIRLQVRFPNPGLAPVSGGLTAQVTRPGVAPRQVRLERDGETDALFSGVVPPLAAGTYGVTLLPPPVLEGGLPTTQFEVEPPAGEFEHIELDQTQLMRLASVSRGLYLTPRTTEEELLAALPAPQLVPLDTDPPIALWSNPLLLTLFLTLLVGEWLLRKRKQMV